jgi:hypothetical protein
VRVVLKVVMQNDRDFVDVILSYWAYAKDDKAVLRVCLQNYVIKDCPFKGYYTTCNGNFSLTFWEDISVPPSMDKNPKRKHFESFHLTYRHTLLYWLAYI